MRAVHLGDRGWSALDAARQHTHLVCSFFGLVCVTTTTNPAWQEHGPHTFKMTAALDCHRPRNGSRSITVQPTLRRVIKLAARGAKQGEGWPASVDGKDI